MRWTFALTFVILGGWMLCPAERNLLAAELLRISAENYRDVLPEGKEVDAIAGDWILRNEQVLAVIAQPQEGRNANMTVRGVGGMLIDFTRRFHGSDQLSCFYPAAGRFHFAQSAGMSCQVDGQNVDLAAAGGKSGQTVRLSFQGTPVAADGTRAEVTYTLREDADWLEYQVTLINDAQAPVPLPIQDSLRCDGKLFSMHNDSRLKIFTATDSYFGQCYAFQLDEGLMQSVGSGRNLLLQPAATTDANSQTPPPAQIRWSGKIHCSQGLPGARSWAEGLLSDAPRQTMQLKLQSPHGPVPHATVEFLRDGQSLGHIQSDSQGVIRADLLQGGYTAVIRSLGRDVREHNFSIDNSLHADSLSLPAASRVRATILDAEGQPIAAKVQFQGIDGTSDPDFGPTAGIAAIENVVYCARGQFEQPLDPGRYRVIISHGPEFDAETQEIEIGPGQLLPLRSVLPRTVDTRGWVSSDFHSHSSPSGDNVSHQRGRVLNLLAEHIEFAPCTEHNRIDTYADDLLALNATAALATCSGMELTGSPLPINHQNAFPLHRHEHQQDGGGPQTDADPVRQIERLALWDNTSAKVVQMNHPNIPQILGDKDLDGRADEGLRGMLGWMDVIEVHPPQG
ncbi:MAG: hypothetical protein KDA45_06805, partial [Planctomycetales bacterium]|nr:hypothetical protein [Planctomycetales bacterium]